MREINQIDRIKIKLRLAKNTDYFLEAFGAKSHQYILSEPATIEEVNEFEKKYNIELPTCYKQFFIEIGNGGLNYEKYVIGNSGAGPDYGIFKLGNTSQFIVDPSLKYLEKDPFFNENTTYEDWDQIDKELDNAVTDEDCDIIIGNAYSSILFIGSSGCASYLGIMLKGKNKGRVIRTYDEIEYCPEFFKETNFLDWYENWLDNVISGKEIRTHYQTFEEREETNVIKDFLKDLNSDYWQFRRLDYVRSFNTISRKSKGLLWNKYLSSKEIKHKICLLNFLTKFDYKNAKKEMAVYIKEHPLVFLRNLHLYAIDKTNEWENEINAIKIENATNIEVLEYIEFVTEVDLKNYPKKENNGWFIFKNKPL
ncbi:SMI1/KNR4 family protein [Flavobacterium oreochromis]|uniref:SMI1/KNR4 family protein n=1 Tax=Flavobacterium oreochromis TaxID=2906078 RepID=A0ABW8P979_9FLAO|nr:SMI1/KNR4 family protein [Flavobacterium oreochromis]OWP74863.1 hypothetical protein BWG23_12690 [Flavobacterium oreochromis]